MAVSRAGFPASSMSARRMLKRAAAVRREDADAEGRSITREKYILDSILDKKSAQRLEDIRRALDDFVAGRALEDEALKG